MTQRGSAWASAVQSAPEPIGGEAWVIRGGLPRHGMNVFLIAEDGGVAIFDTGSREMAGQLKHAAAARGGLRRVILSHAHPDHRGAARLLGAPVLCHPDAVSDAQGDGGRHDWAYRGTGRRIDRWRALLMSAVRDAGPVKIAATVAECDAIGGFIVIAVPGHAPGHIALWRESDRTVLVGDCFFAVGESEAALSKAAFNADQARLVASLERIVALEPAIAWPGHGPPLRGDVSGAVRRALANA